MLHQTLPFSFHFSPSSSSSSSPTLLSQIELEMECVAAKAFKTKFWPETATTPFKPNLHSLGFEDFWVDAASNVGNVSNGVDEFLVDEFLDFSEEEQDSQEHKQEQEDRDCVSVSSQELNPNSAQDFSPKPHLSTEFDVPSYDKADLEWLSHFVDDSFSEFDSTAPPPQLPGSSRPEPATEPDKSLIFPATQVPARPRTKRFRASSRVRPNATAVTATSTVTTTSSSTSCLILAPPAKRRWRSSAAEWARRCSHCGVQKTPQWRAGPRGAKTLCNACGVRFKSGRLLPEYRPACSPTFSSEIHSNSHRKVLEMRRSKEAAPPEPEVVPAVQIF